MKKIIVTGGLGFIGSNLIDLLISKNYYVINIDKVTYSSNFYNVKEFLKNKNYKFIKKLKYYLKGEEINSKNFFLAIHLAYEYCLGKNLKAKKILFYHLFLILYHQVIQFHTCCPIYFVIFPLFYHEILLGTRFFLLIVCIAQNN